MPGQSDGSSSFAAAQQALQAQQLPGLQAPAQAPAWGPEAAAAVPEQAHYQQQQQQPAVGMGASFAASAVRAAAPIAPQPAAAAASVVQPPRQQQAAQEGGEQHPMMLPVSAVAAGWAPDRAGKAPTGSGERVGWVA